MHPSGKWRNTSPRIQWLGLSDKLRPAASHKRLWRIAHARLGEAMPRDSNCMKLNVLCMHVHAMLWYGVPVASPWELNTSVACPKDPHGPGLCLLSMVMHSMGKPNLSEARQSHGMEFCCIFISHCEAAGETISIDLHLSRLS